MNDTRVPLLFAAVSYWLIGFSPAYVLAFRTPLGAVGVWIGLSCGTAVYASFWSGVSGCWRAGFLHEGHRDHAQEYSMTLSVDSVTFVPQPLHVSGADRERQSSPTTM